MIKSRYCILIESILGDWLGQLFLFYLHRTPTPLGCNIMLFFLYGPHIHMRFSKSFIKILMPKTHVKE
jgi:hypothetical protein